MADSVKTMLTTAITLADQVAEQAGSGMCSRPECWELRSRAKKLAAALRRAVWTDLFERPAERIMAGTMQALVKACAMTDRCFDGHFCLRRFLTFNFNPVSAVPRALMVLDAALADVTWLLRISSPHADDDLLGLPNIARSDPMLFLVWDHIARLHTGCPAVRADSASNLASLARDNPHFAKLIIEEDGVQPLINLLKAGTDDAKEAAATALGLLGRDEESVDKLLHAGVCSVYAAALKELPMRVKAAVAEAIALLAHHDQRWQDSFAQTNAARLLVSHLDNSRHSVNVGASSSRYPRPPKPLTSLHSVVLAKMLSARQGQKQTCKYQMQSVVEAVIADKTTSRATASPLTSKGWSCRPLAPEEPVANARMKTMAAKALWKLTRGHAGVCQSITESGALLCLARLLEKASSGARTHLEFYSAMTIMEFTRVAERNLALRQSAFRASSKAVVEQLLRIVRKGESDDPLLLPCITSLGCLSRTFTASETRVIGLLVELLDNRQPCVTREAILALTKFVCTDNHLHVNHSKAIVDVGGAQHLVLLVYLGDKLLQIEALILLCYIALHVPENEKLAQAGVLAVLLWASKQAHMAQDLRVQALRTNAKTRLELFQSRGSFI